MKYVHLELKVCEGCGMLWLRRKQLDGNYCAGCNRRLANYPARPNKRGGGRPRTSTRRNRGCAASTQGGAR